jgi:uncharacterized membrane protein
MLSEYINEKQYAKAVNSKGECYSAESSLKILRERFAKGEINKK